MSNLRCSIVLIFAAFAGAGISAQEQSNIDDRVTAQIEAIVKEGIAAGEMPGAVIAVANRNRVLYLEAFGNCQSEPDALPMRVDTVFDMASLTKPIATGTSIMRLVDQGKLQVEDPVVRYIPEFAKGGKEEITISDLLLHVGGLIPDNSIRDYHDGTELAWTRIFSLKPSWVRGEAFKYSDVGFLVLGKVVERISSEPLDVFADEQVFTPLGMNESCFNPSKEIQRRAAPTEKRNPQEPAWIQGVVHDPRSHLLGGVTGHAGLFSTASDLVRYGQMMLGRGQRLGVRVLSEQTFALMTKPRKVPLGTRAFAWDHRSPYSSNRGESFSDSAIGHGGFTGTVMWIDPEKDRVFIFLSNRLHPDGKGSVNRLAGRIATWIGNLP